MNLHLRFPFLRAVPTVRRLMIFLMMAAAADAAPQITSVTPPAADTYASGSSLDFTVSYSEAVTMSGGTPTITLTVGNARRFAYYVEGSSSPNLVFRYPVAPGDNDGNGISVTASSLSLYDATIRNTGGEDAVNTFAAPNTSGVLVDNAPIVTAIRRHSPRTTATGASEVTYRVSFSETVTGVDATDFVLTKTHAAYGEIASVTPVGASEFDVAIANVSGNGTLRLDLKASGTGIVDAGGQPIAAGFTAGQIYAPLTASFPVGWGNALYGRLGINIGTGTVHTPRALKTDTKLAGKYLVDLAAGGFHSVGLTADGRVFSWGRNNYGQLGLDHPNNQFAPQPVEAGALAGKTMIAIAAGGYHALAVDSDGKVYAWGRNDQGQLGDGTNIDSDVPVAVGGLLADKAVVAVAAGDEFSAALTSDGRVYTWGDGGDGQLGHSNYVDYSNVPVAVSTGGALSGKTVIAIAAGSEHILALTTEGRVYAWGSNGHGQLGTNQFGTNRSAPNPVYHGGNYGSKTIVAIAAGWDHSIALTSEGRTYVWGENDHGQIGNNGILNRNDPGLVNVSGALSGKFVTAITGGDSHTAALSSDGRVYVWGFNDFGQIGNGASGTDVLLPAAVNATDALAGKTVVSLGTNWGGVFSLALAFTPTGPRIMSVTAPAAEPHRAGDNLDFTVSFNNPVTVNTTGEMPCLELSVDANTRYAEYLSGSGSDTLVFRYTVQAGETDADGIAVAGVIELAGGTIKDDAALDATLTFSAPDTTGVIVDTTAPAITSALTASGTYGAEFAPYAITASGDAVGFDADGLPAGLSVDPETGLITGTPTTAGNFEVTLSAVDAAGNAGTVVVHVAIAKAAAVISLSGLSRTYDGNAKTVVAATTPADLPVLITYNGSAAAPVDAGSYTVVATIDHPLYGGTTTRTLEIDGLSQTINFSAPSHLFLGQSTTLSATASSGLPVSFSVISGPASLSGTILTTTGVGAVTVRASQAGSGNYDTAPNVDRSFNVTVGPADVTTPEEVPAPAPGGTAELTVVNANPNVNYQWQRNGSNLPNATGPSLTLEDVQPPTAGLYTYTATVPGGGSGTSEPVIVGLTTDEKVIGEGEQVLADVLHPNGNVYDQVLLEGNGASITANPNKITRISFVDLTNDIVQVEFSGAGTLSVVMDDPSQPAPALNYNQENVDYVRGHVGLVITGAKETSNLSIISVGPITAVNQTLFKEDVVYDGVADIAFVAIQSANGKFGSIRTGNTSYYASQGFTGVYAPGVEFAGPINIGEVTAFDSATPVLVFGSAGTVNLTGGNLEQANGEAVRVSGIAQVRLVDGTTSQGVTLPAQQNQGVLIEDGVDVTSQIVVNP